MADNADNSKNATESSEVLRSNADPTTDTEKELTQAYGAVIDSIKSKRRGEILADLGVDIIQAPDSCRIPDSDGAVEDSQLCITDLLAMQKYKQKTTKIEGSEIATNVKPIGHTVKKVVDNIAVRSRSYVVCEHCGHSYSNNSTECYHDECANRLDREALIRDMGHVEKRHRILERADVPKLFWTKNVDLKDFAVQFNYKPDMDYFITGSGGTGKSHLAGAMLVEFIKLKLTKNVKYIVVPQFILNLKDTFSSNSETESDIIERYSNYDLLVLDDFGSEKSSEYNSSSLYVLINSRINNCLPTIITSNLLLSELHADDPRIASRLGGFKAIEMTGKDRRLG